MKEEDKLEEKVLAMRQIHAASDDSPYRKQSINAIYREYTETNPSGALAIQKNRGDELEMVDEDLGLKTYRKYMEMGEETDSFYPYAAAAATAKEQDLEEELYRDAVYKLGKETTGMERKTVEEAYGIEIEDIREVLSERKDSEKSYTEEMLEPAY